MRVIVRGPADFTDKELIETELEELLGLVEDKKSLIIMNAGAMWIDKLVEDWAFKNMISVERYHLKSDFKDKGAEIVRNDEMLEARPDFVLAFFDSESHYTKDLINKAKSRKIRIKVILC